MMLNFIFAFIICGLICLFAQVILDNTSLTPGHITSIFVVIGCVLEFLNLYQYVRKIGGIGASLPIISFGSIMMEGVKERIIHDGFLGIFTGVFSQCGGLIAFTLFLGVLGALFVKPKS